MHCLFKSSQAVIQECNAGCQNNSGESVAHLHLSLHALPDVLGPLTQHLFDEDGHPVSQNREHFPDAQHLLPLMHVPAHLYDSGNGTELWYRYFSSSFFIYLLLTNSPSNRC